MPTQAETIAALQQKGAGLNPVYSPQSPANPYAAAMTFGSAVGLPDAIKALKGEMTPEEAKDFAVTSAIGLIPGAEGEGAAIKGAKGLAEHLIDLPGSQAAKHLFNLAPEMQDAVLGHMDNMSGVGPGTSKKYLTANMQVPKAYNQPSQKLEYPPGMYAPGVLSDEEIDKALAKNPGASIFDVSGTNVGGPSSDLGPLSNSMKKNYKSESNMSNVVDAGSIPRTATPYAPTAASVLGQSENLAHGTRLSPSNWEGGLDMLKMPDDEIGVHFGNPKQAAVFTGDWLDQGAAPRTYPAVVATNNPLRLPDLGTWHTDKMVGALKKEFPADHDLLDQMDDIGDVRNFLQSKGYDSIVYKNSAEDEGHDSYIKFTGSPEAPNFVTGVRSPWAQFDPTKLSSPSLLAGVGGAAAMAPSIDPDLLKALQGQGDQQ